jgi:glycosyltransferase involved in cell wall biosynthesis
MASLPYFVLGPNALLSLCGLVRGPDTTPATPPEDWRQATVDVVIPALQEEQTIVLCLASVLRQTLRPRRIMLVDDGSTDRTVACAKALCAFHGIELVVVQRRKPIGKTPTIKRQARELDSDVEFILDGDTILESENYLERAVEELYKARGIGSVCGTILPLRQRDRRAMEDHPLVRRFIAAGPWRGPIVKNGRLRRLSRGVTNLYRDVLYMFLQRFVYRGQMVFFGTVTNPVGCAVAYRREYVKSLFDHFNPELGDDLTTSEDIFLGMAMLNEGYRNVQLTDVYARTVEPELGSLPRQVYLWSSSFLQSCYYFDGLLRSPFRAHRRWSLRRQAARIFRSGVAPARRAAPGAVRVALAGVPGMAMPGSASHVIAPAGGALPAFPSGPAGGETVRDRVPQPIEGDRPAREWPHGGNRRVIGEPYRQAFGREQTHRFGRPAGWMLLTGAAEKILFPTVLLAMVILGNWNGLALTVAIETGIALTALVIVTKGQRLEYLGKGLAVTPIRYAMLGADLAALGRFVSDLWLTGNRKWRK